MRMRLRCWGVRGSIPAPGPATVRYGGNTPCVELRTPAGALVILDAGTGLRLLGQQLQATGNGAPRRATLLLTHAHWDHIQGLPFFAPLYEPGTQLRLWAPAALPGGFEATLRAQMAPAVFPVGIDALAATIDLRAVDDVPFAVEDLRCVPLPARHQGGCLGYRLSGADGQGGLAYLPDNELGPGGDPAVAPGWRARAVAWAQGADVLVHDATYTAGEIDQHRGWGHSTDEEAVDFALEAGVRTLVLFHHEPDRDDDAVDRSLQRCRERVQARGATLTVLAAYEGLELDL
jgi:phosphoribosyl 1,2-cyclic phosphodiesterase